MIYEWKKDGVQRNFGDALAELITPPAIYQKWKDHTTNMYFPLGSVICNEVISETLALGYKPVFIGCGWRGEQLDHTLISACEFRSVRGPHTAAELFKHGIEVDVMGDPAYIVSRLISKAPSSGLALLIPHILDDFELTPDTIHEYKADAVCHPSVDTIDDVVQLIHQISAARFVLTGSMHAAIIAHAYGVPFAPLNSNYIDCAPKWFDWMASVELGPPIFVDNVFEGRKWYNSVTKRKEEENGI